MEAYRKNYHGFKASEAVRVAIPPRRVKVLGSTTHTNYKAKQGVLQNEKYVYVHKGISKLMDYIFSCIEGDESQINDSNSCRTRV